ncbi:hypothetical protein D5b_00116 [Faustovirus]|nr:hypothetical protein D5b_00116 [Faustovirus]AMN84795.1 hypothetical protein D6_00395 [Faustovirus]AMP44073.1 hypothetical protein PRJ_Dakar_00114 [Faustovirus]
MSSNNTKIEYSKQVTAEFVINEGKELLKVAMQKYKDAGKALGDTKYADELLKELQYAHRDFAIAYPIALRYICYYHMYHERAMKVYLAKITAKPPNEEEYLDLAADYVVLLHRLCPKSNPFVRASGRLNTAESRKFWIIVRKQLAAEKAQFKKIMENATKRVEADEKRFEKIRRDELMAYIKRELGDQIDEPISDAPTTNDINNTLDYNNGNINSEIEDGVKISDVDD